MEDRNVHATFQANSTERMRSFYAGLAARPLVLGPGFGRALPGFGNIGELGQEIFLVQVDCAETATMRAWELGGEVIEDVVEIRGAGWLSLIKDPAGRKVGLFQLKR